MTPKDREALADETKTNAEIADRMQQTYDVTGDIWFKRATIALRAAPPAAEGAKRVNLSGTDFLSQDEIRPIDAALHPSGSAVAMRAAIEAIIVDAMLDTWNTICSDTNCHPLDIEQLGKRRLGFHTAHWSRQTAARSAESILALAAPQPQEWQPIKTAPRLQEVLLWWKRGGLGVGGWDDEGEGWRCQGDGCVPKNQSDCTHWMPKPAAPLAVSRPQR